MIPTDKQKTFGGWVRKRRRDLDLTQQALADQLGCTRITLRRIEAGTLKPSRELAGAILKRMGVPDIESDAWIQFARGMADEPVTTPRKTNLPAQITSFIGREKEMREIREALSKYRLVTLTGIGGTGKSRISLQVAAGLLDAFPDGVWLIELAALSDPHLIPPTILDAIGLSVPPQIPPLTALYTHLNEKKALLILDNCEHMLESCAELVSGLLKRTHDLKILATSREVLGVHGESFRHIPPLSFPQEGNKTDLGQLLQYEAIQLFIERAHRVNANFALNRDNARAIAEICLGLDGIPLAIELAAARMQSLSVEQIHDRLDDRFHLLASGGRTLHPRHQTLQATIDWSYNLLSEEEKTLFRRLAVFTGGWTLEAAESICSGDGIKKKDLVDLFSALVKKSLIFTDHSAGMIRYRWLETVRQFGREKFQAAGEAGEIQKKYLQYYVDLAESAEPGLRSSDQMKWFARLELELDNLRTAMGWAKDHDSAAFLRLTSPLWAFFRSLERKGEGIECLAKAVEANKGAPTKLLSTAMARLARLCTYISIDRECGAKYAREALELSRQVHDEFAESLALIVLSEIEYEGMDVRSGVAHAEQALRIAQGSADHWLLSAAFTQKGKFLQLTDQQAGMAIFEESLREAKLSGDKYLISSSLFWIFVNLFGTRNFARAKEVIHQRIAVVEELGDTDSTIYSYNALANIGLYEGDYRSAAEYAETVTRFSKDHGHDSGILHGLGTASLVSLALRDFPKVLDLATEMENLLLAKGKHMKIDVGYHLFLRAWVLILEGDLEGTRQISQKILETYKSELTMLLLIECLQVFSAQAFMCGDYERQAILASVAAKLRRQVPVSFFDYPFMAGIREEQLARSREMLGDDAFQKAWADGQAMTQDESKKYLVRPDVA